jgi:hypothetical protein
MTAPVASGWSGCRVGFAPTGKRRLVTAHTPSRHREIDFDASCLPWQGLRKPRLFLPDVDFELSNAVRLGP